MNNFNGLGLNPVLATSLARMIYNTPTPIQAQAIPLALEGRDILGSAQTGTGKTAAFAIPVIQKLLTTDQGIAVVLTPTRELGKQIMDVMNQMLDKRPGVKTAFIIGGEPMTKQIAQLRKRPRLIVGTPGRINDHLNRGNLYLDDTMMMVLDETDRMLDMGFSDQLERIFGCMPHDRQTLMFSATMPKNIVKMSEKYLSNPERIAVGSTTDPSKNIKQEIIRLHEGDKYDELTRQLDDRSGSVVVFVKTKFGTERMAKRLNSEGYEAEAIHGDLRQSRRERVIKDFRAKKYRILVATDVAARGLDIPHIEHVINYDLPQVAEDYIHRIGRTARAGAEGSSLCLISPQDGRKWYAIEMLINPDKKPERPESGNKPRSNKGRKPTGQRRGAPASFKDKYNSDKRAKPQYGNDNTDRGEQGESRKKRAPRDNSPNGGDKPFARKKADGQPAHAKPFKGNASGDRPVKGKSFKPKTSAGKTGAAKANTGKPYAGKSFGSKSGNGKPAGGKNTGGKPFSGKSFGGKSFKGGKKPSRYSA